MAIVEANPNLGAQIVADAKEYVLYSWSVQDQITPIPVAGAEGRHFWDYDGKRYLDFASQLVNVNIGHQHPKIVQAIKDQADQLCTIGPPMANESRSRLGRMLADVTPGDLSVSFFTNGGAEANENAVKLARLVTGRNKIVARYRSYHGATNGAVTLTGDPRRWAVEPGMPGVVRMFDPYTYRCPAGHPDPCPVCTGAPHLEEILEYEGAHTVAAVILETVTGTNGDHPAARRLPPGDPRGLRPPRDPVDPRRGDGRLRPHRAVVRLRALGRRPRHHHGREGDQLGLRPARRDDRARRDRRPGARPVLPGRPDVRRASPRLCLGDRLDRGVPRGGHRRERRRGRRRTSASALRALAERHPSIGDVRGLGCFWGVELVKNRETKEMLVPFNASGEAAAPVARLAKAALEQGLYLMTHWNVVMVVPPLTVTRDEVDDGIAVLDEALAIADEYVV